MTIEQRKIELINWITSLQEESLISQMENFKKHTSQGMFQESEVSKDIFKTFSQEEMLESVEKTELDIEAGRTINMVDFKQELESWKTEKNTK